MKIYAQKDGSYTKQDLLDLSTLLVKVATLSGAVSSEWTGTSLYIRQAADVIEELAGKSELLREHEEKEQSVFASAIAKWGDQAQVMMVFEEMSELQKELCKNWRGKNNVEEIADEVADVEIMLDQLKMIYGIEHKVQKHRAFKIARLAKRLEAGDGTA